jgi:hypothetical protein
MPRQAGVPGIASAAAAIQVAILPGHLCGIQPLRGAILIERWPGPACCYSRGRGRFRPEVMVIV